MSSIAAVGAIAPPSARSPAATGCAALLVLVWIIAMAQLLWQFEKQRIAAAQQLMHFDPRELPGPPLAAPLGTAKAIYFIDTGCRCSAAALAEIARLQRSTALPLAQFVVATAPLPGIDAQPLSANEQVRWRGRVPPTPSVALWSAQDELIYFGPISVGGFCSGGTDAKSYLQTALLTLQQSSFELSSSQPSSYRKALEKNSEAVKAWDVIACACPAQI